MATEALTDVTAMLCGLCTYLEENYEDDFIKESKVKGLASWWKDHKKLDAKRRGGSS